MISLSSIIEGFNLITCSCVGDECAASKRNIAKCWPEPLHFDEAHYIRKLRELDEQRVAFANRTRQFEMRRAEAFARSKRFDEEPPDNPELSCSARWARCKANLLCIAAYFQYGTACRPAIEKRSEPCSTQCAARARVLYSVSGGSYFSCVCDPDDRWCRRKTDLIAAKCFGFSSFSTASSAATGAAAVAKPNMDAATKSVLVLIAALVTMAR